MDVIEKRRASCPQLGRIVRQYCTWAGFEVAPQLDQSYRDPLCFFGGYGIPFLYVKRIFFLFRVMWAKTRLYRPSFKVYC